MENYFLKTDNMFKTYTLKVNKNKFLLRLVFVSFEKFIANKKNRARWKTALSIDNSLRYLRTSLIGHIRPWTINSIPFGVSGDMFLTCAFRKNKIENFR